jgi:hypothetical protein
MSGAIPLRFIGGPLNGQRKFFAPETAYEGSYYRVAQSYRHRFPGVFAGDMPAPGTFKEKVYEYKVKVISYGGDHGPFAGIKYLGPADTSVLEDLKKRFAP